MEPLLFIDQPKVTVRPGEQIDAPLRVRNVGNLVEEFEFEALGLPSSFASFDPSSVSLFPSEEGKTKIVFAPRKVVPPVPGPFSFGVRAVSAVSGEASAVAEGVVEILPFGDIQASLRPDRATFRRKSIHHVVLENYGNVSVRVMLHATDSANRLKFHFERDVVEVGAGSVVEVRLRVHSRLKIRGAPDTHQCQVVCTPIDAVPDARGNPAGPQPIKLTARLLQRSLLPAWAIPLAILAALIALVLTFIVVRDDRLAERPVDKTGPPPPPTDVTATPDSPTSIQVAWSDAGGEDGYQIFQQTQSSGGGGSALGESEVELIAAVRPAQQNTGGNTGGNSGSDSTGCKACSFVKKLPSNTTSYTVTDLTGGNTYCFFVTATYKGQSSLFSQPSCTAPSTPLEPCVPTGLTVAPTEGSTPSLLLSWGVGQPDDPNKPSCDGTTSPSFRIQQDFATGRQIVAKPQEGDTATTIDNLQPSTRYCYQIQAVTSVGSSEFSDGVCGTTAAAPTSSTTTADSSTTTTTTSPPAGGG